ncbi:MAG: tRNA-intron lyase [Candidatus Iainarchaeum archaeon]|uniref:tRNA-intron lyase n=1 Tax=Candidatus Iainarchaeum sp. TaxID=3101447 RepID=A0A7T9DJB3_9ARCH|nr:MAG: tRNA-intron lyase [Candidatus Diapherotrites archaeon]
MASAKISDVVKLMGEKGLVMDPRKADQLRNGGFGENKEKQFVLDAFELVFLLEKEKISVKDSKNKRIASEKLLQKFQKSNPNFFNQFQVFHDLRTKGHSVKTGFKFGSDFRVYPKGKRVGEAHTEMIVNVHSPQERLSLTQLARFIRLAQTLHTQAVLAVVDGENEVNYYSIARI